MHLGDSRVPGQHGRGVRIDERIEFGLRGTTLQYREDRRGEQHIAVMTQLDDERSAQRFERNCILDHGLGR
jgi:hypothetical protein